jgi:hypothetical protein
MIARLNRFIRLPAAERRLLLKAALLLGGIKLGLWLLDFHALQRLLSRVAEAPIGLRKLDRVSAEKVVWSVKLAGRYMPMARTCLTQAMTTQALLARRGYPTILHIGVVTKERGEFEAHAWLESEGEVVIGGHDLERYTPLASFEREAC